jgi:AcrR family transcriptional regulator
MAEKKRPRRTRERILETSLALFNRFGEPHVTTADIADEMNISPGNLYYHFRNKDEIVGELHAAFDARVAPLLQPAGETSGRHADVEDLWLLLHLLFEQMWEYRFIYRDLDDLASRNARLAAAMGEVLRNGIATMAAICRGMAAAGTMRATDDEIAAVSRNAVLVATYWLSFQRLTEGQRGESPAFDPGKAAHQVIALIAPFLVGDARALFERQGGDYLMPVS